MAAAAWNTLFGSLSSSSSSSDRHRARWQSERIAVRSSDDDEEEQEENNHPSSPRINDSAAESPLEVTLTHPTTSTTTNPVATTPTATATAITSSSRFSPTSPRQRRSWQTTTTAAATTTSLPPRRSSHHRLTLNHATPNESPSSAATTQQAENGHHHHHHNEEEGEDDDDEDDDDDDHDHEDIDIESFPRFMRPGTRPAARNSSNTTTMTLAELEDERELARRRSSACMLLAAFVLFRLWILAIEEKDFGLLLLCLVGTSWTARWIGHSREREDELDRRIAQYLEQPSTERAGGNDTTLQVDRNELRMLSFQAQLALAIMESQRQMMQGGYGHPDGPMESSQGVSEQAKATWQRFAYAAEPSKQPTGGSYGSLALPTDEKELLNNNGVVNSSSDEPHCSICLAEYETGDQVVQLPCHHLYHDECISSWTSNHVKCPLCNLDLQVAATMSATTTAMTTSVATATVPSSNTTSTLTMPTATGPSSAATSEDSIV